ncbi:hypothetical protein AYO44_02810 [Planctomycetaceae bacterium SCGC AG-212-F19]|nr:hypothetical protein AYO44_02810 [Planctomycetaceae bacterium SCGC AG-212-F19]
MVFRRLLLLSALAWQMLADATGRAGDNELTAAEKRDGFVLLFNGKDLGGFREHPKRGFNKWLVEEGAITLTPAHPQKDPNFEPYPLWTVAEYGQYVLKLDFRTAAEPESGHSSVILRVAGKPDIRPQPGVEVAVYGPARKLGYFCTGAFRYSVQPPSKIAVKPAGEWNSFVITVNQKRVAVELNGEKVNDLNLDEWTTAGKRPDGSNFPLAIALKDLPAKSPIGFRDDYGIPVWYKNIKLKPLP